jgi:hypothetical protein
VRGKQQHFVKEAKWFVDRAIAVLRYSSASSSIVRALDLAAATNDQVFAHK